MNTKKKTATEETSTPNKTCRWCRKNEERPTGNNTTIWIQNKKQRQKKLRYPTRPGEDVVRTTKGLQERTQQFEWDDGETWNKDNYNFYSNSNG